MRREHAFQSNGETLPPFAENLVFWAPLTQGDITDHISGIIPTIQGSATWDSSKGMYLLDSTQNSQWKAALQYTKPGGFNINCNDGWSMYAEVAILSSTWNYNALFACTSVYLRNNGWSANKQCFSYSNPLVVDEPNQNGMLHKLVFTAKAGDVKYYKDSQLVSQAAGYTAAQQTNPPTQVDVCASNTNSNRIRMYARDVRLYNRNLTASEVAQL